MRPLFHGRLLLAGQPRGADGIDAYDAACMMLAYLSERYSKTEFNLNPKGDEELLRAFGIGRRDPDAPVPGDRDEAEELRRQMAERAAAKKAKSTTE